MIISSFHGCHFILIRLIWFAMGHGYLNKCHQHFVCFYYVYIDRCKWSASLIARFIGPTWGLVGPRCAPCRPHEPSYLAWQCTRLYYQRIDWFYRVLPRLTSTGIASKSREQECISIMAGDNQTTGQKSSGYARNNVSFCTQGSVFPWLHLCR